MGCKEEHAQEKEGCVFVINFERTREMTTQWEPVSPAAMCLERRGSSSSQGNVMIALHIRREGYAGSPLCQAFNFHLAPGKHD